MANILTDPSTIVAQAAASGKPLIFVTFNYRLNIFGFGDGTHSNLALKDQRLAISWVVKHIGAFGGDKVRPAFIDQNMDISLTSL